jgi:predicted MFS family arabinose efflux permease
LLPYYLLPIWAGIFDDNYGFDGSQIGLLLAADMAGGTVAAACARLWIARAPWRPVLFLSLLVCAAANLVCAVVDGFGGLLLLRTAAGLAAGTYMALVYADFAHADSPDREFSIALALQVAFGAAAIWCAPTVQADWGRAGTFVMVGLASLLPFALFTACPKRALASATNDDCKVPPLDWRTWLGLTTVGLFFIALSCVWVAMERLGTSGGFDAPVIARVLSAGLLFSFLGAAAPAVMSGLAPRRSQIYVSYAALAVAIILLGNEPTVWLLAGGLIVYNFFYSFVIPYQTAWVAETDVSGRTAVLVPVVQGIGVSVGPIIGGALLGDGNYGGVIVVSVTLLGASLFCAFLAGDPIAVRGDNLSRS